MHPKILADKNEKKELIVYFYSPECWACEEMAPINAVIKQKYLLYEFNLSNKTDKVTQEFAKVYHVSLVPTALIFKNGKLIKKFIGFTSYEAITKDLKTKLEQQTTHMLY